MRFILSFAVIITGIVILFNNLGVTDVELGRVISTYWPVVLLVHGINLLLAPFKVGGAGEVKKQGWTVELLSGIIIAGIGAALLLRNLGLLWLDLSTLLKIAWPVIIILVGISFLRGKTASGKSHVAFMGGLELGKRYAWDLKSSSYLAFMGGIELDLTRANIPEGETILDLVAVMGGISIIVPENLPIIFDGMAFLGGVEFLGEGAGGLLGNKQLSYQADGNSETFLRIQARSLMGGIEIKM